MLGRTGARGEGEGERKGRSRGSHLHSPHVSMASERNSPLSVQPEWMLDALQKFWTLDGQ